MSAVGAVDRGDHGVQRGHHDGRVDADAPVHLVVDGALDVRSGSRVVTGGESVLAVVHQPQVITHGGQCVEERRDGAVPTAGNVVLLAVQLDRGADAVVSAPVVGDVLGHQVQWGGRLEVFGGERLPHRARIDLATRGVGVLLDRLCELDLQFPGQVQLVFAAHDVGDTALAGLRVDADHGFVATTDVLRVDRQVRNLPRVLVLRDARVLCGTLVCLQPLVDGVLVAAGEGGEHQVTAPWAAFADWKLVAVLHGALDLVHVGEVDLRVDSLTEQVHTQRDEVDVAGTLAVTEQATLDAVGTRLVTEFGGGDAGAAIVVRVQREDHRVATFQVAVHPLDRVGVHVRCRHFHGGGQVQNHRPHRGGLHDLGDRVADFGCVGEFGAGVGLRGVLEPEIGVGGFGSVFGHDLRGLCRDPLASLAALAEHHITLQDRRGVVEVHDGLRCALQCREGLLDQVRSARGEHLDTYIVRNRVLGDDFADEVEVGLAGRGEPDLDFLVPHPHQQLEEGAFARG